VTGDPRSVTPLALDHTIDTSELVPPLGEQGRADLVPVSVVSKLARLELRDQGCQEPALIEQLGRSRAIEVHCGPSVSQPP
jgi:hypothetical protein